MHGNVFNWLRNPTPSAVDFIDQHFHVQWACNKCNNSFFTFTENKRPILNDRRIIEGTKNCKEVLLL